MSAVNKVFSVIEEGLNYQYNTVWPQVFHLMTAFVDAAGKECQTAVGKCLTSLADLRGSVNFSLENELDQVGHKTNSDSLILFLFLEQILVLNLIRWWDGPSVEWVLRLSSLTSPFKSRAGPTSHWSSPGVGCSPS